MSFIDCRFLLLLGFVLISLSLDVAAASIKQASITCTDECIRNCANNSTDRKCIVYPTYEERNSCVDTCPCECNTHCYDQCKQIGLNSTCDSNCGCIKSDVSISINSTSTSQTPSPLDSPVAPPTARTSPSIPATPISSNMSSIAVDPILAVESQEKSSNFTEIFSKHLKEGINCVSSCWKPCLNSSSKSLALECINNCGCQRDSSYLLLLSNTDSVLHSESQGNALITTIFILFMTSAIYLYYRKKQHQQNRRLNKGHENMHSYHKQSHYEMKEHSNLETMLNKAKSALSCEKDEHIDEHEDYQRIE